MFNEVLVDSFFHDAVVKFSFDDKAYKHESSYLVDGTCILENLF